MKIHGTGQRGIIWFWKFAFPYRIHPGEDLDMVLKINCTVQTKILKMHQFFNLCSKAQDNKSEKLSNISGFIVKGNKNLDKRVLCFSISLYNSTAKRKYNDALICMYFSLRNIRTVSHLCHKGGSAVIKTFRCDGINVFYIHDFEILKFDVYS